MKGGPTESDPVSGLSCNGFLFFGFLGQGPGRLCYSGVSGAFCHLIRKFGSPQRKRPPFCCRPIRTPLRGHFGPRGVRFNSRGAGGSVSVHLSAGGGAASQRRKSQFRREQVVGPEREQSWTFPSSLSRSWPFLPPFVFHPACFLSLSFNWTVGVSEGNV